MKIWFFLNHSMNEWIYQSWSKIPNREYPNQLSPNHKNSEFEPPHQGTVFAIRRIANRLKRTKNKNMGRRQQCENGEFQHVSQKYGP